jgi:hypothetical protein
MDKHQILEKLQHIIVCYNQLLRAAGLPVDLRLEIEMSIDSVEAIYKKLKNKEVVDYKHVMNKRNQI